MATWPGSPACCCTSLLEQGLCPSKCSKRTHVQRQQEARRQTKMLCIARALFCTCFTWDQMYGQAQSSQQFMSSPGVQH